MRFAGRRGLSLTVPLRRSSASPSALALCLLLSCPAAAQEAVLPPGTVPAPVPEGMPETDSGLDPLLEPLPPIPDAAALPAEAAEPVVMEPVAPLDAELLAPLPVLGTFDPAPRTDFAFSQVAQEGVRYRVTVEGMEPTGLEGQFRRLSGLARGQNRPATAAQIASRASADKVLMERLLFSEGWYGATVEVDSDFSENGATVRIIVVPGERYSWRQITLDLIPEDRPELAEGFGLQVGDPIRAIEVEEAEGALLLRLNTLGYPFAEIGVRDVVLDTDKPTGTYLLTGDIGPLGIFGPIRMTGFQPFDTRHAEVIARFEPGQPYDARLVDDFRRALIATQQFGGVTVSAVDSGLREADGRAVTEIVVAGNRGPQRLLTGQIGYATEEGFRAEGAWRHRSFLRPEGMLTTRVVLGTEEQRASAQLTMSNWRQRDRTLSFGADLANLTPPAYNAQQFVLSAGIGRASTPIWQKRWTWGVAVLLGASREESRAIQPRDGLPPLPIDAGETRDFLFFSVPGHVGHDRSNDLLDPTSGFRVRLDVQPEVSREAGRTETYGRFFLEGTAYRQLTGERGSDGGLVLAGRARVGSIVGADLVAIAPTRRLYAGGGGSVRGYDYQGVGELGANGRPIGGRGLTEASVEARYRFGAFGAVGFVDAGSVNPGSMPSIDGMRFGVGVGARYYTTFGPLRIDVARAVARRPGDPQITLYISIGQAF